MDNETRKKQKGIFQAYAAPVFYECAQIIAFAEAAFATVQRSIKTSENKMIFRWCRFIRSRKDPVLYYL
jgi:hypothetical protein